MGGVVRRARATQRASGLGMEGAACNPNCTLPRHRQASRQGPPLPPSLSLKRTSRQLMVAAPDQSKDDARMHEKWCATWTPAAPLQNQGAGWLVFRVSSFKLLSINRRSLQTPKHKHYADATRPPRGGAAQLGQPSAHASFLLCWWPSKRQARAGARFRQRASVLRRRATLASHQYSEEGPALRWQSHAPLVHNQRMQHQSLQMPAKDSRGCTQLAKQRQVDPTDYMRARHAGTEQSMGSALQALSFIFVVCQTSRARAGTRLGPRASTLHVQPNVVTSRPAQRRRAVTALTRAPSTCTPPDRATCCSPRAARLWAGPAATLAGSRPPLLHAGTSVLRAHALPACVPATLWRS